MSIQTYLSQSSVTEPFRSAVEEFLRTGRASARLSFDGRAPMVKVERTLTKVLLEYPHLDIESIEIRGSSGCEYFRGELTVRTASAEHLVHFHWDCKWRAEQNGWHDYFGFADQARAAREFGWDCFRGWEEASVSPAGCAAASDDAVMAG